MVIPHTIKFGILGHLYTENAKNRCSENVVFLKFQQLDSCWGPDIFYQGWHVLINISPDILSGQTPNFWVRSLGCRCCAIFLRSVVAHFDLHRSVSFMHGRYSFLQLSSFLSQWLLGNAVRAGARPRIASPHFCSFRVFVTKATFFHVVYDWTLPHIPFVTFVAEFRRVSTLPQMFEVNL